MDRRTRMFFLGGLAISLAVAIGLSQLASDAPDGLEYVAEQQGFDEAATQHDLAGSPLADYGEGLTGNSVVDTAIAGLVGVVATLAVGWAVFRLTQRRDTSGRA